jgi:hypothetical protein
MAATGNFEMEKKKRIWTRGTAPRRGPTGQVTWDAFGRKGGKSDRRVQGPGSSYQRSEHPLTSGLQRASPLSNPLNERPSAGTTHLLTGNGLSWIALA